MLRRDFLCCSTFKPYVERASSARRRRHTTRGGPAARSRLPDLPKSAGGYVFQQLRPRLPIRWQYGWRWTSLKVAWLAAWFSVLGSMAYVMFFKYTDEDIARQAAQYTYVRNEGGEVVDIGFKPIIDASKRARRRADRLLDPDEAD